MKPNPIPSIPSHGACATMAPNTLPARAKAPQVATLLVRGLLMAALALQSLNLLAQRDLGKDDAFNLGRGINSSASDICPQINPSGTKLYFTSTRFGELGMNENVYACGVFGDSLGEPVLLPEPLNSKQNEGAASFSADGQMMVYSACLRSDGYGSCDLYVSYLKNGTWSEPVNMGNTINTNNWEAHPCLSSDGLKLFFSSNRGGGFGGDDLYVSEKNAQGQWQTPVNLGSNVNTSASEISPFLAPDESTLYFSSDSRKYDNYGEYDIFKVSQVADKWTTPTNLGNKVNTRYKEKFFTTSASGEYAYFASTKPGGYGGYDIYKTFIPPNLRPKAAVILKGNILITGSQEPVEATLALRDSAGKTIATGSTNSETGAYLLVMRNGGSYQLEIAASHGATLLEPIDIPYTNVFKEITKDFYLEKVVADSTEDTEVIPDAKPTSDPMPKPEQIPAAEKAIFDHILFETGAAQIDRAVDRLTLDRLASWAKAHPKAAILLDGHTDDVGSPQSNMALSIARGQAVKAYLVAQGVAADRIDIEGFGELKPTQDNASPAGRTANRRVKIWIKTP